jgi:hypothetical protein
VTHPAREEVLLHRILWLLLAAANLIVLANLAADKPAPLRTTPAFAPVPAPDPAQGYAYGMRGSQPLSASVISTLDISPDPRSNPVACITLTKGPYYAATDPDLNGYPGCTILGALDGTFFEDKDSAQVVLCWHDRQGLLHFADNLAETPAVGRTKAARWQWADAPDKSAACVRLPLGPDAVDLTVLVVYTDVLYAFDTVYGPEDGPAIIASWDARFLGGAWHILARNEVGIGCWPDLDENLKTHLVRQIRTLIETRTSGHYTLQERYNLGQRNPADHSRVIVYDSGFDIVPKPPQTLPVATRPSLPQ